jgi:hypothetical protein
LNNFLCILDANSLSNMYFAKIFLPLHLGIWSILTYYYYFFNLWYLVKDQLNIFV